MIKDSSNSSDRKPDYIKFLKYRFLVEVLEFRKYYPDIKTLTIEYAKLNYFDNEAGEWLINHPDTELNALKEALGNLDLSEGDSDLPDDNMSKAIIAIKGLSETTPYHKIGQENINKLISIEGRITKSVEKYQKLVNGAFKCVRCGDTCFIQQPDDRYLEPYECQSDACGRKGPFKLIEDQSEFEDQQKIGIQDLFESAKPGQPLKEMMILLKGAELIESIPAMGVQCTITGIVRSLQKKESSIFKLHLEAIHIEPKEAEIDLSISEAEKREFKDIAARGDLMDILISSTAPEILGFSNIKAALLCSIVSGGDNPYIREYLHVVLCGEPGTGKTALMRSLRSLVPRAQYSAGRGSSVAGLTVALDKDELLGGGYTAKAGALVLADHGLMILDEADKLEKPEFQALNTALEESFIEIHKGGINQRFNTRCPVIALCNPKNIRFDQYEPLKKQITIPGDTLSRFGLIFKIQDIPNPKNDRLIAEHQARQWARYEEGSQEQPDDCILPQEKLRKFLQYAKTFKPRTTPNIRKEIIEYYLQLRATCENGSVVTTARQNNDLYRLVKSIAKLRLASTCTKEDLEKAIHIHKASLEALRDPQTGKIDMDILFGSGQSQRDRLRQMRGIILELQSNNGGSSAHYKDIIAIAAVQGIKGEQADDGIRHMKSAGDLIEVSESRYRVV